MKKNTQNEYQIKPKQKEKFRPGKAKEIIREILESKLKTQTYSDVPAISRDIADVIKNKLKDLGLPRYKYIVQVTIGQQKGQGVRIGGKCFWDFDTDYCATETFQNDFIFCLVNVYGVYLY